MYRRLPTGCECDVFEIFIPECRMSLCTSLHESCIHHPLIDANYRKSSSHCPPYTGSNTHPLICLDIDLICRPRNPCLLQGDRLRLHGAH